ncbi:MAG: M3 family metallopeptidase [Rikenellaceae bacterium]
MMENSLVKTFDTPPFSKIKVEDYKPAILWAIEIAKERIQAIIDNKEEPSFDNVLAPLETASEELDNITSIFFNLNHANTSERMQEIAIEMSPVLTDYSNSISLNAPLFEKIKRVYLSGMQHLDDDQRRTTTKCFKSFERSGANLHDEKKERYCELTTELSKKLLQFDQNILAATNDYFLHLTDEKDLAGLPEFVIEGAAAEATERDLTGWVVTLQAQSMIPFMQYSERRELREIIWRKYAGRCYMGEKNSNIELVRDIVNLRLEKANLLGYTTHADYVLEERMAKDKERVTAFLSELLTASLPYGKKDVATVAEYARKNGFEGELMGWDFAFYSEKYKKEILNLSDEKLKPYFELSAISKALFDLCTEMYGITFIEDNEIDKYHKDIKTYKVYDGEKLISILYIDFFPRATKNGGAWMTTFRDHHVAGGIEKIPQVSVVCNFSKPTTKKPSLLTFNEVTTLFHEFGHALHGMFATGRYQSISGTNVAWDFVELPSQIMENWAIERKFLERAARHYKTGEVIPTEYVDSIIEARNFLSGYASVRQLSFGIGDMAWHMLTEPFTGDVRAFEAAATDACQLFPNVNGTCFATAFSHIFSGGYSAGYYSYKWAEVLEADAFTRFEQEGVFNPATAADFRDKILSKGDSRDAMDLYISFMGREPRIDALLTKLGLKS